MWEVISEGRKEFSPNNNNNTIFFDIIIFFPQVPHKNIIWQSKEVPSQVTKDDITLLRYHFYPFIISLYHVTFHNRFLDFPLFGK